MEKKMMCPLLLRGCALVLAFALCLGMGISAMAADTQDVTYEEYTASANPGPSSKMAGQNHRGDALTGLAKTVYDAFSAALKDAATSRIVVSFATSTEDMSTAVKAAFSAYIADQSDVVYWLDKTVEARFVWSNSNPTTLYAFFSVIDEYKDTVRSETLGNNNYIYWDLKLSGKANDMKEAQGILSGAAGKSDADKVAYFVQRICGLTSYDTGSAQVGAAYNRASQMTSVFDGDPATGSICEGYAKAFQYLCDSSGLTCLLATGHINAGSTAPGDGAHMWNLVQLGGKWWVVDATNCDAGTVGAPDKLVLVGKANATYQQLGFRYDDAGDEAKVANEDRYDGSAASTYSITEAGVQNVTLSYSPGQTGLAANTQVTITITPATGYENPQLYVDNAPVALTNNAYTFNIGSASHTVSASATRPDSYSVTVQDGEGVTVSADRTAGLRAGDTVTVTVTAAAGYESPVGLLDGIEQPLTGGSFTFTVSKNHTVGGRAVRETLVEGVAVTPSAVTIGWSSNPAAITGMQDLVATVTEKAGKSFGGPVAWKSSNTAVVNVVGKEAYNSATKTAVAALVPTGVNGTATITATAETKTATCTVTVSGGKDVVITPDVPPYIPGTGGSSSSSSGKSKSESTRWWRERDNETKANTSSPNKPVNENTVVADTASAVAAAIEAGEKTGSVRVRDALSISAKALRAMQAAATKAGGSGAILQADTMKGKAVESRIYLDTSKVPADMQGDIKLRVHTSNKAVQEHFEKYYKNKIAVVRFEHTGPFGQEVEVATKVDLNGMNEKNLVFYAYDNKTNSYTEIAKPGYFVDGAGYLHFLTPVGGNIVISDGPLSK